MADVVTNVTDDAATNSESAVVTSMYGKHDPAGGPTAAASKRSEAFPLETFFPYRLSALAEEVSHALAAIYRDRFDLTRPEWRVLATLACEDGLTAGEVGRRATLDKMDVSRAVRLLERKRDIERKTSASDKRTRLLCLTEQGRRLYARIAPLALARQDEVLSVLSREERDGLLGMIDRIERNVRRMAAAGE